MIYLVGRVRIDSGTTILDESRLGGRHARLVFALLVLERHRPVSRDELAEALWPSGLPRAWESALRGAVSKVRAFLSAGGIDAATTLVNAFGAYQLRLGADVAVDVERAAAAVDRAEEALRAGDPHRAAQAASTARELAADPLLPGVDAEVVERARTELREVMLRSLLALSTARRLCAEPALAVAAAEEAVGRSPFTEAAHLCLIQAHAAAGNRAQALLAYDRCRRLLADELGVDPAPPTQAAHLAVLRGEPAVGEATSSRVLPASLAAALTHPLAGRTAELDHLQRAWRSATRAQVQAVFLAGEPGIGKTRLLGEAATIAHDAGGFVLYGRCEEDPGLPYLPFAEALGMHLEQTEPERLRALLSGIGAHLCLLVPQLRHRVVGLPDPPRTDPASARYLMFEALVHILAEISAEAPVMLAVDDLHWADRPTLLLMRHLLRTQRRLPLLLLGSFRDTEPDRAEPVLPHLAGLMRVPGVRLLDVGGLDGASMGALVRSLTGDDGDPAWVGSLARDTAGNPLFAIHLIESGSRDDLPRDLGALVGQRVDGLPGPVVEILECAAVLGRDFDLDVLAHMAGSGPEPVLDALDLAERVRLVVAGERAGRYAFVHAVVRSALRDRMARGRRMRLHLRAALALESARAGEDPTRLAELAHHFGRAAALGGAPRAAAYAHRAGDQARAGLAYEQAALWYQRGLDALDGQPTTDVAARCDLQAALGDALHRAGDPRQRSLLLEAAASARALGDPIRLARAALALEPMGYYTEFGRVDDEVVALLEEAQSQLPADEVALRARLLAVLALELAWVDSGDRSAAAGRQALRLARTCGDPPTLAHVLIRHALTAAAGPDHVEERLAGAGELIALGQQLPDVEATLRGHHQRFDALMELGDIAGADVELERADRLASQVPAPLHRAYVTFCRAGRALFGGQLDDAEKLIGDAYEQRRAGGAGETAAIAIYATQLHLLRLEQGRLAELELPMMALVESQPSIVGWQIGLLHLYAETSRPEHAREGFARLAGDEFRSVRRDPVWLGLMTMLADVAARLGHGPGAAVLARHLAPYTGRNAWIGSVGYGPVDRALGVLAAATGDPPTARRHLAVAAAQCRRWGAPTWLARVQHAAERA
jgi:DNA-binding SARP family transcriptional activator/HPt (histidine-containing phosphotransfer) domain-containing protein